MMKRRASKNKKIPKKFPNFPGKLKKVKKNVTQNRNGVIKK